VELALAEENLSLPQFRVLNLLAEAMAVPSSLADRLDVRRPTITSVMDGLVSRGLVVRKHDSTDRRKVSHQITAEGRRLLVSADKRVDERLRRIASGLGDDSVDRCIEGLSCWGPALLRAREKKLAEAASRAVGASR
jgi:long-chain acyl-CoA synthetase